MGRQHVHAAITAGLAITLVTSGVPTAAIAQTLGIDVTSAVEVERTDAGEEQGGEASQPSSGQESGSMPSMDTQPSAASTPENESSPISGGSAAAPELSVPAQEGDAPVSGADGLAPDVDSPATELDGLARADAVQGADSVGLPPRASAD